VWVMGCTLVEVRVLGDCAVGRGWRRAISVRALWSGWIGSRLVGVVSLVGDGSIDKLRWLLLV